MLYSRDETPSFAPNRKPKLIILGTMVAICARTIEGRGAPQEETFYYHNNRNHFWRVMQHLFDSKREVKTRMSIEEKKAFLNRHRIGIQNLVYEINVPKKHIDDPSDTILFEAYTKKRLKFKKIDSETKKIMESVPLFFTCRSKTGIKKLIEGYREHNSLREGFYDRICFWPTPTRCNPYTRSLIWKDEMKEHLKGFR